jgi:hypothetical protein
LDGWQESPPFGSQQNTEGADDWQVQASGQSPRGLVINQKAGCRNFQAQADGFPLSRPQRKPQPTESWRPPQGLNQNPIGGLPQGRDFLLNGWRDEDMGKQLRQEVQLLNPLQGNERAGI